MTRIVIDPGDLATMSTSLRSGAGDLSALSSAVCCDTSCMPPSTAAMIGDVTTNASALLAELVTDLDELSSDLAARAALATADASSGFTAAGLGPTTPAGGTDASGQTLIISNALANEQSNAGGTLIISNALANQQASDGGTLIISNALANANAPGPVVLVGGTGPTNQPVTYDSSTGTSTTVLIGGDSLAGATLVSGSAPSALGGTIIYTPPHEPMPTANMTAAIDRDFAGLTSITGGIPGHMPGGGGGLDLTGLAYDSVGAIRSISTLGSMTAIANAGGPSLEGYHSDYAGYSGLTGIDPSNQF
jgi:hypothetical protein